MTMDIGLKGPVPGDWDDIGYLIVAETREPTKSMEAVPKPLSQHDKHVFCELGGKPYWMVTLGSGVLSMGIYEEQAPAEQMFDTLLPMIPAQYYKSLKLKAYRQVQKDDGENFSLHWEFITDICAHYFDKPLLRSEPDREDT